ncbi:MAG: transcriptional activator NhaR [Deltaproteobacteria bacterium]|nr:transcriptional activator NhaR [Deltaproteobacteria bacterium]
MEGLNYHHLYYFYVVAREGGVSNASTFLRLASPTISGQVRQLEESLGEKLFDRVGRGLVLTDMGETVFHYAEEIFATGRELLDTLQGRPTGRPQRLTVGVADMLPKLIAHDLVQPALSLSAPIRLVIRQGTHEQLVNDLATGRVDVVLSDSPVSSPSKIKAFNHVLGECGTSFVATAKVKRALRGAFPECLTGAPMLAAGEGSGARRAVDAWLDANAIRPLIQGEFADSALLKVFGSEGLGFFSVPTAIEASVCEQFSVVLLGRVDSIRARFFAISGERKVKHPAVLAICASAKDRMFA